MAIHFERTDLIVEFPAEGILKTGFCII